MSWTLDRIEILKALWKEGDSASYIASRLGGVTRSAVIGKAHRLGLAQRASGRKRDRLIKTVWRPRKKVLRPDMQGKRLRLKSVVPPFMQGRSRHPSPLPVATADDVARVELLQLTGDQCRWPVGHPDEPGFGFCGCRSEPGLPYCDVHAHRAYQPARVAQPSSRPAPHNSADGKSLFGRHRSVVVV